MSTWAINFTGRRRKIKGRTIYIKKQPTEVEDPKFGKRQVLTLARYENPDGTIEPILLKIRYDLRPDAFDLEDMAQVKKISDYHYLEKTPLVENVAAIGHDPRYIDHVGQPVEPDFPYQMVKYSSLACRVFQARISPIYTVVLDLNSWKVLGSNSPTYSNMRQCGFILSQQHPSFLWYIVDYTFMDYTNPNSPRSKAIDAESIWVLASDIWKLEMFPMLADQLVEPRGCEKARARYLKMKESQDGTS